MAKIVAEKVAEDIIMKEQIKTQPPLTTALASSIAACSGELITTAVFYPIELVKTRLQAASSSAEAGTTFAYKGLTDGIVCIVREDGVLGLFSGITSAASRSLSAEFATVTFGEWLLARWTQHFGRCSGAAAVSLRTLGGCASVCLTLPVEAIATRVTTSRTPIGAAGAAVQLFREGGLRAFWKGLLVSFVLCLNPALMLTTVDKLKALVLRFRRKDSSEKQQMSWGEAFMVGAVAKLLTMSLVYPLVRGKVLLQARNTQGAGLLQVLAETRRTDGLREWYRGLGAQLSKSLLSASIKYAVKEQIELPVEKFIKRQAGL